MQEGICGIYKITNKCLNKSYIGQSRNIENRIKQHFNKLGNYNGNNKFYKILNEYPNINDWCYEILEECERKELNNKEIYWINYFNSCDEGFNSNYGGNQVMKDMHHTEEAKRKISLHNSKAGAWKKGHIPWNKGIPMSEETKQKMIKSRTGIKHTEETKKRISEIMKEKAYFKGKHLYEETRIKISNTLKGRKNKPHTEEAKQKISLKNSGKKHTDESKKKMREAKLGTKKVWNDPNDHSKGYKMIKVV